MASVGRSSRYRFLPQKAPRCSAHRPRHAGKSPPGSCVFLPSTEAARASQEGTGPIPGHHNGRAAQKHTSCQHGSVTLLWKIW